MPRTPLLRSLSQLAGEHRDADLAGISPLELRAAHANRLSRRAFLRRSAAAGTALAAGSLIPSTMHAAPKSRPTPSVAIVGAGIAGLTAALTLADGGIDATVFEASDRAGGRIRSNRTSWADAQVSEWGGELIDSGHKNIRALARRFNLSLTDVRQAEPNGTEETYFFGGAYYPVSDADADFQPVHQALQTDVQAASYPTTWDVHTDAGAELDAMTVYDWIETRVPGGHSSRFGRLLDVAYNIEYGAESTEQSALNLVYLLGYGAKPGNFEIFGASDERFHVDGGNDQITTAIAAALPRPVETGWRLSAIAQDSAGVSLTFRVGGRTETVRVDRAILTVPFTILRTLNRAGAGFDARKERAIAELGGGHNGKLQLQYQSRRWNQAGPWGRSNGGSYTDTGYQNTWEVSRGQPGNSGILVNYTGAEVTDSIGANAPWTDAASPLVRAAATSFNSQLEPVFPGLRDLWNGRATLSLPHLDANLQLAYSFYRPGQYVAFGGYEAIPQGRIHFAGEHTTQDFQGYMEGGAITGVRAATEILSTT